MLMLLLFYWDYYIAAGFGLVILCVLLWLILFVVEIVANFLPRCKSKRDKKHEP